MAPRVLPLLPLRIHAFLPDGFRILAQSSKAGAVPREYIATLGDSYAQGAGDWLLEVDPRRNPPFHSAHLIHQRTGRDVVTFGASGAGSIRALVTEPAAGLAFLRRSRLYAAEDPAQLLVYFYEGNDLNDNVLELQQRFTGRWDDSRLDEPAYFRRFLQEVAIGESPLHRARLDYGLLDDFVLSGFALRLGRRALQKLAEPVRAAPEAAAAPGRINRARVGGREEALPDGLQSPALELREDELARGLRVFEGALDFLVERFASARIALVYIPSPLACYRLTSPRVHVQVQAVDPRPELHDRAEVARRSDRICRAVEAAARRRGVAFADARPGLRRAGESARLHGPRDWKHLNRHGQQVLVDALEPLLADPPGGRACAASAAGLEG